MSGFPSVLPAAPPARRPMSPADYFKMQTSFVGQPSDYFNAPATQQPNIPTQSTNYSYFADPLADVRINSIANTFQNIAAQEQERRMELQARMAAQQQSVLANQQANAYVNELPTLDRTDPNFALNHQSLMEKYPHAQALPWVQNINKTILQRDALNARQIGEASAPLLAKLSSVVETDPDAPQQIADIKKQFPENSPVWRDQRALAAMNRMESQVRQYHGQRQAQIKDANRDLGMKLAQAGIAPEEHAKYQDDHGNYDPLKASYAIGQAIAKQKAKDDRMPLDTRQRESIQEMAAEITSPGDPAKQAAWEAAHPGQAFDTKNAAHWSEGYKLAKQQAAQKLQSTLQDLHDYGFKLPGALNERFDTVQNTPTIPPIVAPTASPAPAVIEPMAPVPASGIDQSSGEAYGTPSVPAPQNAFQSLSGAVAKTRAQEDQAKAQAEIDRAKIDQIKAQRLEDAKNELVATIDPATLPQFVAGGGGTVAGFLKKAGKRMTDTAYETPNGTKISWGHVAQQVLLDSRLAAAVKGQAPAAAPAVVTTKAQYDSLPSGAIYVDSHGKTARKK